MNIHKPHNVVGHILQREGIVMVRVSKVSRVQYPHISDALDFVIRSIEERNEILMRLHYVWEPDQSWQVRLSASN